MAAIHALGCNKPSHPNLFHGKNPNPNNKDYETGEEVRGPRPHEIKRIHSQVIETEHSQQVENSKHCNHAAAQAIGGHDLHNRLQRHYGGSQHAQQSGNEDYCHCCIAPASMPNTPPMTAKAIKATLMSPSRLASHGTAGSPKRRHTAHK